MTQDDLKRVLRLHSLWLANEPGGKRANLIRANLIRANLWSTRGNGFEVRLLQCGTYNIAYTAEALQIGCQRHPIARWWEFSDDKIDAMDGGKALAWWRTWKPLLQQIIAAAPATPCPGVKEGEGDE